MEIDEFIDDGFLLEANRQFFHPLGMRLEAQFNEDESFVGLFVRKTDDPEGTVFQWDGWETEEVLRKAQNVARVRKEKNNERRYVVGNESGIQDLPKIER